MNMSVTSTIASPATTSGMTGNKAVDLKSFQKVRDDLQSGDMAGAQKAFSTMTRNVPSWVMNDPSKALGQLNQALQSGNTSAAQQALGTFAQNVHSVREAAGEPVVGSQLGGPVTAPLPATSSTGGTAGTLLSAVA